MALRITLKPRERMIIGGAVISNGDRTSDFLIENRVPILREKDIMTESEANTPCRRIRFAVQLMYIDEKNLVRHHETYWKLVHELVAAAPSTVGFIDEISEEILKGDYYKALKKTEPLIAYERELLDYAEKSTGSL